MRHINFFRSQIKKVDPQLSQNQKLAKNDWNSQKFNANPHSNNGQFNPSEILCKIKFELNSEQQLFVFQQSTIKSITEELLRRVMMNFQDAQEKKELFKPHNVAALEKQIKEKLKLEIKNSESTKKKSKEWIAKMHSIIGERQKDNPPTYFGYSNEKHKESVQYTKIKNIHKIIQNENSLICENDFLMHQSLFKSKSKENIGPNSNEKLLNEDLKQCTFHPRINKNQEKILKKNNVFDRLYKQAQNQHTKRQLIQEVKSHTLNNQIQGLTFIPKINVCSKQIVKMKKQVSQSSFNVFEELYKKNNKEISLVNRQQTFHPEINPISRKIVEKNNEQSEQSTKYFRLQQKVKKKDKISNKIQRQNITQINRVKSEVFLISDSDTTEPQKRLSRDTSMNQFRNRQIIIPSDSHSDLGDSKTIEFHSRRKQAVFQQIYYLLKSNKKTNQLTADQILNNTAIPQEVFQVLKPIALEMRQLEIGLDKEQFTWSLNRIYDTLPIYKKGQILGWGIKSDSKSNFL